MTGPSTSGCAVSRSPACLQLVRPMARRSVPEPVRPELLTGDGPDGAWDTLAGMVEAQGFSVQRGSNCNRPTALPTWWPRTSRLRIVSTVLRPRKLWHTNSPTFLMHNGPLCDYLANRGRCEVEAECVAFFVCDAFGLASDGYSFA